MNEGKKLKEICKELNIPHFEEKFLGIDLNKMEVITTEDVK